MARFDRDPSVSGPVVRGFAESGFLVDGRVYRALLLTPLEAAEWAAPSPRDLTVADVEPLLALDPLPEFLLLGTGTNLVFPSRAFIAAAEARGVGVETMPSRAAARTWGMLRGEGRWIAAALMPLA